MGGTITFGAALLGRIIPAVSTGWLVLGGLVVGLAVGVIWDAKKRSDAEEGGELFAPVGYIGGLVLTVIVAFIVAGIFDNDDLRVKRCMEQTGLPGVKCCGLLDIDAKKCITQALPKGKDAR